MQAFNEMCINLELKPQRVKSMIDNYLFTEIEPRGEDIIESLKSKPKILERRSIIERTTDKILEFIETFIEGL